MEVDFYALERPVQDRFADATRGAGLPSPLSREPAANRAPLYWGIGIGISLAALVAFALRGFGNLASPAAIEPLPHAGAYALLTAALIFTSLRFAGTRRARKSMPYEPGLYLFPVGVFDARSEPLRVFRHEELTKVETTGAIVHILAGGRNFEFRFADPESASSAGALLSEAAKKYDQAVHSESRRDAALLDPLVDSGFSNPFSSNQRITNAAPIWATTLVAAVVALAAGAALGSASWKVRNTVSEGRLYSAVRARDDVDGYRAYLARGGTRADVSDVLLPRAELKAAAAIGTVEALEAYVATHPGSRIQAEVDAAVRAAVGAELSKARSLGTVTALREFQAKRARYTFIASSVDAALNETFRKALDAFVPGKDPSVGPFYERLLGYSKAKGARVVARFVRKFPESVERADEQVKRSAYFMGKDSIPSQYFTGEYAEKRESGTMPRVAEVVRATFPDDMLHVEPGPTLEGTAEPSEIQAPTLTIEYTVDMSGGIMSPKPRGVFVGVGMTFIATFRIPGDAEPLTYKFFAWRMPNPQILKVEGAKVADVYEKIASDAFEKFLKGFSTYLVGK